MPQWVNGVPLTCWYDTVTDDANVVIGCDAGSEPAALGLALTAAAQPTSYEWSLRDQATHDIVSAIATTEAAIGSYEQPASALVGTEISVTASDGSTSVTVSGRTDALPGGALLITCMQAATDRVELEMCFSSQGVSLPSDKVELVKAPAPAAEASASPAPEASSSPDASSSPEVSPTPEVSPSPSASAMPSATATNTDDPSAPPT
jgi:hypothetical protein